MDYLFSSLNCLTFYFYMCFFMFMDSFFSQRIYFSDDELFFFHAMGLYAQYIWWEWNKVLRISVKFFKSAPKLNWFCWKVFGLYRIKRFFRTPLDASTIFPFAISSIISLYWFHRLIRFHNWAIWILWNCNNIGYYFSHGFFSRYKRIFNSSKYPIFQHPVSATVNVRIDHQIGQFFSKQICNPSIFCGAYTNPINETFAP